MSIKLAIGRKDVDVRKSTFPAGESCIRLDTSNIDFPAFLLYVDAHITFKFEGNSEIFDLALVVDAVRRAVPCPVNIYLHMPYLPYAQQDRLMVDGESLSSKVMCDFINSLNFTKVYCSDIHSDVGAAMLNNLVHKRQRNCAAGLPHFLKSNTVVISPDAGAAKKAFDFAKHFSYDIYYASKVRDVSTGKIVATYIQDVYNIPVGRNLLIVDDLCIGGATFISLAEEMRKHLDNPISLYVTHGVFSDGVEKFIGIFDKIYVHNLMNKQYNNHPLIEII